MDLVIKQPIEWLFRLLGGNNQPRKRQPRKRQPREKQPIEWQPRERQPQTQYLSIYKVYHPDFPKLELYGGEHLGKRWGSGGTTDKIEELLDFSITNSICLIQDHELDLYSHYKIEAQKMNMNFKLFRYPIVDMSVPTKALMVEILDKIDELIVANQGGVYIHCLGGHGRTGTVIGCWLKRHGFEQHIYTKLASWRQNTLFGTRMSTPQRLEQFQMINDWEEGE